MIITFNERILHVKMSIKKYFSISVVFRRVKSGIHRILPRFYGITVLNRDQPMHFCTIIY